MPDFRQLYKVLMRETPERPVLFEMMLNDSIYRKYADPGLDFGDFTQYSLAKIQAFHRLGYDYACIHGSAFCFPGLPIEHQQTISLNAYHTIADRADFQKYRWPDPAGFDYALMHSRNLALPEGMKLVIMGPSGVLENVIALTGYDTLCNLLYDDEELAEDLFERVGSSLYTYYRLALQGDNVGAIVLNDDWGFNTQPMLSPAQLRRYVFPWHKAIIDLAHSSGRPVILHSCGNYTMILGDLFSLGYDGRHSYEDNIIPVEKAYEQFQGKIAVMGGIDMDFLVRSTPEKIRERCEAILQKTGCRGYALGSGNSIPEYMPFENYLAMIETAKRSL